MNDLTVAEITDPEEKERIARAVLEALKDWFGIDETREAYIRGSRNQPFFAAKAGGEAVGFLALKETGRATVELAVMGVLTACHRQGIGQKLVERAIRYAKEAGYAFMQVKTVQYGRYPDYDATNLFYQRMGFQEFECFPTLWDEANPCQVYVMALH